VLLHGGALKDKTQRNKQLFTKKENQEREEKKSKKLKKKKLPTS
jgi:hypothetical protein